MSEKACICINTSIIVIKGYSTEMDYSKFKKLTQEEKAGYIEDHGIGLNNWIEAL